ncbi:PcfJ domain-containing protein [Rhodoferax sediminis]|nr:PcfJ domain-containing protein [Rhodoferax sediminis]
MYQYQMGNALTALQPTIDFSALLPRGTPSQPCVVGPPPPALAGVHAPVLINAWHKVLLRCLAQPTQLELRAGQRRVHVLGAAIFDFASDGTIQVYVWQFNECERLALVRLEDQSVVVQGVPHQALWMDGLRQGALRTLRQWHHGQDDLCQTYVTWAQQALQDLLWTPSVQARVRRRIATVLALEPALLDIAQRIQLAPAPVLPLRLNAYNHVVAYRQDYVTLDREAPQLIPLYALLARELGGAGEVTARMKAYLCRHDLKPALWRLLCREGTQWLQTSCSYFDFHEDTRAAVAVELLALARAFGTARLAPSWLLHGLLQLGGNPNGPARTMLPRLVDLFGLCARLGVLAHRADAVTLVQLQDNVDVIFGWASKHVAAMPGDFVRHVGLAGLLHCVHRAQQEEMMEFACSPPWRIPYQLALPAGAVQPVILDSALAVWQEGQEMHHCVDRYIERCASGEWLMVSLRGSLGSGSTKRGLATVAFNLHSRPVHIAQISGFANGLVEPPVLALAQLCAGQLEAQRRALGTGQDGSESTTRTNREWIALCD